MPKTSAVAARKTTLIGTNEIVVDLPGHGIFRTDTLAFDAMIEKYLPTSPSRLRALVSERANIDYSDVLDVTSLLMVLAELDGFGL